LDVRAVPRASVTKRTNEGLEGGETEGAAEPLKRGVRGGTLNVQGPRGKEHLNAYYYDRPTGEKRNEEGFP